MGGLYASRWMDEDSCTIMCMICSPCFTPLPTYFFLTCIIGWPVTDVSQLFTIFDYECYFVRTKGCTGRLKIRNDEKEAQISAHHAHNADSHNHFRDRGSP